MSGKRRTVVYVDAFNLYYGCLRKTPFRWLDLRKLCQRLLPSNDVVSIKYFTARVKPRGSDNGSPRRQQLYLRALKTLTEVEVIYGHFSQHDVPMRLSSSSADNPHIVKVVKVEEKGSDVNLAAHLIQDAYEERFEVAAMITNDSDLLKPVQIVRGDLGYTVGVLNPHPHPSKVLREHASFLKQIRESALKDCQFAERLTDGRGSFERPPEWV